jgi:Icc protein
MTSQTVDFVHLSDLHLSHAGAADPHLLTDTASALREVIATINARRPAPAFVVIAGDIVNHGDIASYRLARDILADLQPPVVHALGNHDNRSAFRAGLLGRSGGDEAPCCHETTVSGVQIIVLDSSVTGRVGGAISADQFDFLEAALARENGLPKLIVVHHPPALDDDPEMLWESLNAADTRRLAETLAGHRIEGILCGHTHFDRVIHWHGIPVIVGTGLHNGVDVAHAGGMRMVDAAGYAVCTLRPSGLSAAFVHLERGRRHLATISDERLRAFDRD